VKNSALVARENQLVIVTGWVRLTKISDDDCDIHIQLSADPAKHFRQVIPRFPRRQRHFASSSQKRSV
jgi:hypothetical protein